MSIVVAKLLEVAELISKQRGDRIILNNALKDTIHSGRSHIHYAQKGALILSKISEIVGRSIQIDAFIIGHLGGEPIAQSWSELNGDTRGFAEVCAIHSIKDVANKTLDAFPASMSAERKEYFSSLAINGGYEVFMEKASEHTPPLEGLV